MNYYSVNVVWGEEDNCFIATVPEFDGLSAHGDTQEEAIKEARIVLEGFIEVMKEDGEEIPAPQAYNSFSGQTRIRLPKSLHRDLSNQAKHENVSLNTLIINLLSERNIVNKFSNDIKAIRAIQENNIVAVELDPGSVLSTDREFVFQDHGLGSWPEQ